MSVCIPDSLSTLQRTAHLQTDAVRCSIAPQRPGRRCWLGVCCVSCEVCSSSCCADSLSLHCLLASLTISLPGPVRQELLRTLTEALVLALGGGNEWEVLRRASQQPEQDQLVQPPWHTSCCWRAHTHIPAQICHPSVGPKSACRRVSWSLCSGQRTVSPPSSTSLRYDSTVA